MCEACRALIDREPGRFTLAVLRDWKRRAEDAAALALRMPSAYRALESSELHTELSIAERVAFRAREEEFAVP